MWMSWLSPSHPVWAWLSSVSLSHPSRSSTEEPGSLSRTEEESGASQGECSESSIYTVQTAWHEAAVACRPAENKLEMLGAVQRKSEVRLLRLEAAKRSRVNLKLQIKSHEEWKLDSVSHQRLLEKRERTNLQLAKIIYTFLLLFHRVLTISVGANSCRDVNISELIFEQLSLMLETFGWTGIMCAFNYFISELQMSFLSSPSSIF